MKKLLIIFFITITTQIFGQPNIQDTSYFCIPNEVARKILGDLNELDRLKEVEALTKEEINSLEEKINLKDSTILVLIKKDELNEVIVKNLEEKTTLQKEANKKLEKEIKKRKIKNTIFQTLSTIIVGTLTYLLLI